MIDTKHEMIYVCVAIIGIYTDAGVNTPLLGGNAVLNKDNELIGVEASLGKSVGGDVHINETYTYNIVTFQSFINWIKDLVGWDK